VLSVLIAKKRQMVLEEKSMESQITREFLLKVKQQKQQVGSHLACCKFSSQSVLNSFVKMLERVSSELSCIDSDLATVQADIRQDRGAPAEMSSSAAQDRALYPENDEAESSDVDRPSAPEVPDDRARTLTFAGAGKKRKMDEREASPEKYHPKQK
jgi:hypothetical protein